MKKELYYIAFLAILLVSCEEIYTPDLEESQSMMVVESQITNDQDHNFVKLTKSLDFYSTDQAEKIEGAQVELIESEGSSMKGIESSTGYFTFSDTPIPGKTYYLRIIWDNNIYESEKVVMPPLPTIDTLYTNHAVEKSYTNDIFGKLVEVETPGRNICIDAPITSKLEYYRFDWRAIMEWTYSFPLGPTYNGWIPYYNTGNFNLAGPKQYSVSEKIQSHPVLFLGYDSEAYLDSVTQLYVGWIVIIDEYGTTKDSYDYHEGLNEQFSAEGSLFDPVSTQVYGNIKCTSDPTKLVLGFFDLNSYRQYRYYIYLGSNESSKLVQRQINRYLDIPNRGYVVNRFPDFWEYYWGF